MTKSLEQVIQKPLRKHKPVLVQEVLDYLHPEAHKTYLDVTFGTGGHTQAILDSEPNCKVIAMDWDAQELEAYAKPLQEAYGERLRVVWGNFALLYKIAQKEKIPQVDGILADFGISQIHIFEREGFSFLQDTPLDMRMTPSYQRITAADVLRRSSEELLNKIFWELGEERYARQIARAIVEERKHTKIKTTGQLVDLVKRVVKPVGHQKINPATRIFQALRIYVNKELENISSFLPIALSLLKQGGILVCISFHSLEDRLVKDFFREQQQLGRVEILTSKVVMATEEEKDLNAASRSARLRAVKLL